MSEATAHISGISCAGGNRSASAVSRVSLAQQPAAAHISTISSIRAFDVPSANLIPRGFVFAFPFGAVPVPVTVLSSVYASSSQNLSPFASASIVAAHLFIS